MKKAFTSGLVLLVLGTLCGFLLALVNSFTSPIIEANELAAKIEALAIVYPDINNFNVIEIENDGEIETIYLLKDKVTGTVEAVIYSVSSAGYKTNVEMLIAVDKNLIVVGYQILGTGGTSGLGLDLSAIDFGMTGDPVADTAGSFDSYAGATISSDGIKNCFVLVSARITSDLGGGE